MGTNQSGNILEYEGFLKTKGVVGMMLGVSGVLIPFPWWKLPEAAVIDHRLQIDERREASARQSGCRRSRSCAANLE